MIIIKTTMILNQKQLMLARENFKEQADTGLILLPFGYDAMVVDDDTTIEFEWEQAPADNLKVYKNVLDEVLKKYENSLATCKDCIAKSECSHDYQVECHKVIAEYMIRREMRKQGNIVE